MRSLILFLTCLVSLNLSSAEKDNLPNPQQVSKVFTAVSKKSIPAVVYIRAEGISDSDESLGDPLQNPMQQDPFGDDFFNRFFGSPYRKPAKQPTISQGSGFFVSSDGHILTNAHVVKGASKITIILNDGREMAAEIVGFDVSTDVAVIKVAGKNFPFLPLGNSDDLEIGEWVIAIGSPFQLQASVTVGVISAKGRQNLKITDFEDFLQTDAAINPGNSGGPLINLSGQAIGINTAIVSKGGGYMGIGFAIPSNMAKYIMQQIIDSGSVTRSYLGVSLQPLDQDMADAFGLERPEGALIAEVIKGSPAEAAGLKQGDIIIQYDNTPVKSIGSFRNEIAMLKPGTKVNLKVNRNGKIVTCTATLTSPANEVSSTGLAQKLGMEVEPLTPELAKTLGYTKGEEGVVVNKIKPGSIAAMAGIRPGFLIMAINHKKVVTIADFNSALEDVKNKRLLILAKQGEATRFYSLKIE
jgi:serine protease Do